MPQRFVAMLRQIIPGMYQVFWGNNTPRIYQTQIREFSGGKAAPALPSLQPSILPTFSAPHPSGACILPRNARP